MTLPAGGWCAVWVRVPARRAAPQSAAGCRKFKFRDGCERRASASEHFQPLRRVRKDHDASRSRWWCRSTAAISPIASRGWWCSVMDAELLIGDKFLEDWRNRSEADRTRVPNHLAQQFSIHFVDQSAITSPSHRNSRHQNLLAPVISEPRRSRLLCADVQGHHLTHTPAGASHTLLSLGSAGMCSEVVLFRLLQSIAVPTSDWATSTRLRHGTLLM